MPHSPFRHAHRRGDCYATYYAKKKANQLVGQFGFNASDEDDIAQSLLLNLMKRWHTFNPNESSPKKFISWAIGKGAKDLIREQQRRFQHEPTEKEPLEDLLADEEAEVPSSCVYEDHAPLLDRKIDLEQVISRLAPEIREVGLMLMTYNVSETARKLGIPRRTVRDQMEKLRVALVAAGYEEGF